MAKMQTSLSENALAGPSLPLRVQAKRGRALPVLDLRRTVARQVIPRLHAALAASRLEDGAFATETSVSADRSLRRALDRAIEDGEAVARFIDRLLVGDDDGVDAIVDDAIEAGATLETVYLRLLAPAATRIRLMWSHDLCGFAEATLGMLALQGVVRRHGAALQAEHGATATGARALLVSPIGKGMDIGLPMFGLMLMSEFFRRDGWETWIERDLARGAVGDTVTAEWFDLVEILASSEAQLDAIATGIRVIRHRSANAGVAVMVCGQVFTDHPEYVGLVGADLVAADPISAVARAEAFLSARAGLAPAAKKTCQLRSNVVSTRLTPRDRLS